MKYHLLAAAAATMFALTGAAQAAGFTDIKQINAGDLNVGYVDQGATAASGRTAMVVSVLLRH